MLMVVMLSETKIRVFFFFRLSCSSNNRTVYSKRCLRKMHV